MNAVQVPKFGPADVLQLKTVKIPSVSASKVLVKVIAAGVNPVDTYIRDGTFAIVPELPYTPGMDGAGIIHEVGRDVTRFKVGQRVFICGRSLVQHGTYAEYTVVPEEDVFPLDDSLSFEQGAALGIPYFTAYRALVLSGQCSPDEWVLVHGASGAVGLATVQLAKHRNLKIIGTAGTKEGMELVKNNGADCVLCHKDKDYMEKILEVTDNVGVNIIIEMLANVNLNKDLDVLAPKGRVAVVGCRGSGRIDPVKMMGPELKIMGVAVLMSSKEEWEETSEAILEGIRAGAVKPVIHKDYSLQLASKAHHDIMHSTGAKGKLILTVQKA